MDLYTQSYTDLVFCMYYYFGIDLVVFLAERRSRYVFVVKAIVVLVIAIGIASG